MRANMRQRQLKSKEFLKDRQIKAMRGPFQKILQIALPQKVLKVSLW